MKAQRGSIGITTLFLYLGARRGWVVNTSVHEHLKTICVYLQSAQGNQSPALIGKQRKFLGLKLPKRILHF
jgi:hypothetical protein